MSSGAADEGEHGVRRGKGAQGKLKVGGLQLTQVGSLNLRHSGFRHLVAVSIHGEQAEGFARRGSASSARPLVGRSLTDGCDDEGLHAAAGVVTVLLHKARIYDKLHGPTPQLSETALVCCLVV